MKIPRIDEPLVPGRVFWIACAVLMVLALPTLPDDVWRGPWITMVAWIVLPAFLVTLVLWSTVLFFLSVLADFRGQRRALGVLGLGIAASPLILWACLSQPADLTSPLRALSYAALEVLLPAAVAVIFVLIPRGERRVEKASVAGGIEPVRKLRR